MTNEFVQHPSAPFAVSRCGAVKGRSGRILKPRTNGRYRTVNEVVLKRYRNHYVHRLVAEVFVPNPLNLPEVNHRDGDRGNNAATNLEWTSRAGNAQHAHRTGLIWNAPRAGQCGFQKGPG